MNESRSQWATFKGIAIAALVLVCVLSFGAAALWSTRSAPKDAGAPVTAAQISSFALTPGTKTIRPESLDVCANDPGPIRCFAGVTRRPGEVDADGSFHPSGDSSPALTPTDIRAAYNIPTAGNDPTVAIVVAYGSPTAASDLAAYRSQYELPACDEGDGCLTILNQDGAASPLPDASDASWAQETSIDLDMVSAACPACKIALYVADSPSASDLFTAVATAASSGAHYVSMSWGTGDVPSPGSYDDTYFGTPGVMFFAATGDDGYGDVQYPASSPNVIGVGGTNLVKDSDLPRGWSETAWESASSGCNTAEPKPAWQVGVVPDSACSGAATTDLSAVASKTTPVATVYDGSDYSSYGTSVAAPIVAGLYAAAGVQMNSADAVRAVYTNAGYFNDVTAGSNGSCSPSVMCTAGPGWDGPTGVGTPDGSTIFSETPPEDGTADTSDDGITVDNLPEDFSVTQDPSGASTVNGTLSTPGDYSMEVRADRASLAGKVNFNVVVDFVDADGNTVDTDDYHVTATNLPSGLTLSNNMLTGSIEKLGRYAITLTATKDDGTDQLVFHWGIAITDGDGASPTESDTGSPTPTTSTTETSSTSTEPTTTTGPTSTTPTETTSTTAPTTTSSDTTSSTTAEPTTPTTTPTTSTTSTPAETTSPTPTSSPSDTTSAEPTTTGTTSTTTAPAETTSTAAPTTTPSGTTSTTGTESTTSAATTSPTTGTTTTTTPTEPAPEELTRTVTVHIKVMLQGLIGDGEDAGGAKPSGTILDSVASPNGTVTEMGAVAALSQFPPVPGLTPKYTPAAVFLINLARMVTNLIPMFGD